MVRTVPHIGTRQKKRIRLRKNDDAVSPVIGTILMVAVTVMLAAGVYLWTTVFNSDDSAPEDVTIRPTSYDQDDDGLIDWARLTLVSGEDAPYNHDVTNLTLLDPDGDLLYDGSALCSSPSADGSCDVASGTWDVGESLYVPCQGDGGHLLTITIRGHTVLDTEVTCNEAAGS